ncbi:cytochrome C [Campylobacter jejuni]|uniref:Cytochrome C n=1 Tax=Campylobacter jejuni TaxID=197 RepID=A0A624F6P7_CAMJU|nr:MULTISPECIES: cytochrome c3 family protein [Campylobacter]EAI3414988.1 cytochrome C [Campylobacter jejuni]ECL4320075.1 cytochrome C [Campylobacter jejuni]ECZ5738505.1 cytochrome C [Campylobacter jejuni]EHL4789373.1 cytochrome C [Campylobacter jejuni]EIM3968284.1 cytochrome C [Campylobacter jejuni]
MKKLISKGKVLTLLLGVGFALNVSSAENSNVLIQGEAAQDGDTKPRTLEGYVHQEDAFFKYLKEHHPMFKYEKEGRIVGKYAISDREEEYVEFSNGPTFAQQNNLAHTSVTYRLGMESFLDFPNKFVGPKKCGECHPAQYKAWERSRHAKTVRFPDEFEEVGNDLKKPMYNSQSTILPDGIYPDDVYAVIGTPRTKYGFIDRWLVRGTYHVEDGNLSNMTGKIVAGGNQFSRLWSEFLTPEMTKKIAEFSPGFPTTMEQFGGNGSQVWGTNSYAAQYRKNMLFQPASSYCETCHSFKFDFKSKEEFYKALGNTQELRKHTISKGISCEECHGAGAHLYGARGAGMPSNCERCHQRFSYNEEDAKKNPRKPFNAFFKSSCPACGTEGAQMYSSAHYDKGMRCSTCHDPHEVTFNDWKDGYTKVGLKKTCTDCHDTQASFFKQGGIHSKDNCTACHMPNMMSCENFGAVQNPDKGGFDNVRASHIWKIKVDKTAKTLNPPEGKERSPKTPGWTIARDDDGRFFLDLMWACGHTSFSDPNLMGPGASGCHSAVQSNLPKKLHFTDQETIYDIVVGWQKPVKDGYENILKGVKEIDKAMAENPKLSVEKKSRVITLANQARAIAEKLQKDGSWGVHGPVYSKKIVDEALVYIQEAKNILK